MWMFAQSVLLRRLASNCLLQAFSLMAADGMPLTLKTVATKLHQAAMAPVSQKVAQKKSLKWQRHHPLVQVVAPAIRSLSTDYLILNSLNLSA